MAHHFPDRKEFKEQFFTLLRPEAGFYKVVLVYSLAISLLTLAVPLSVQLLVDTVANIALPRAVFLIASLLFAPFRSRDQRLFFAQRPRAEFR